LAGVIVAVEIRAFELGQAVGFVNIAAGDGAKVAVRMLNDGHGEFPWAFFAFGPEGGFALHDAPPVVAPALNEPDHLPKILPHFAAPESFLTVEAEFPNLSMTERPDFAPSARRVDERIILGNGVRALAIGMVHVDAQNRAEQVTEILTRVES